jgi:hypothetical protein
LTSEATLTEHDAVARMTPTPKATATRHLLAGIWR